MCLAGHDRMLGFLAIADARSPGGNGLTVQEHTPAAWQNIDAGRGDSD